LLPNILIDHKKRNYKQDGHMSVCQIHYQFGVISVKENRKALVGVSGSGHRFLSILS
jgi:hypothetical protein